MTINNFDDLRATLNKELNDKKEYKYIDIEDENSSEVMTIEVRRYLPIQEKARLVEYVINHAIDDNTGLFSPIRLTVFFTIALIKFYCGINFDEQKLLEDYDLLEQENSLLKQIKNSIPSNEKSFISQLVDNTVEDISNYNSSIAGMLRSMNSDASELDSQIQDILSKIKNREGLEILDQIKNVVGED